ALLQHGALGVALDEADPRIREATSQVLDVRRGDVEAEVLGERRPPVQAGLEQAAVARTDLEDPGLGAEAADSGHLFDERVTAQLSPPRQVGVRPRGAPALARAVPAVGLQREEPALQSVDPLLELRDPEQALGPRVQRVANSYPGGTRAHRSDQL